MLAGGSSRRMGTDKAALLVDGQTQLERTVTLLQAQVEQVFVSTRADQAGDELRGGFFTLEDRYSDLGPLAGILTALESTPEEAWLVVACDLPRLDALSIRHLLDNCATDAIATAFRSEHDGLPEPLCAVWQPTATNAIHAAMAQGRTCPRKILIVNDAHLLSPISQGALDNANTPDDLERITGEALSCN
ncbi:MAG: molybdenum cofactor guanylyltransferase [Pseudomonadota bacterium]